MVEAMTWMLSHILAPMLLGGILIVVQNTWHTAAYDLVYPMAYYALVSSAALMPLVLHLAKVSGEDRKQATLI